MSEWFSRNSSTNEIDLHGLTADEALETFVTEYNRRVENNLRERVTVIHGYGASGQGMAVIGRQLRQMLSRHPDRVRFTPGESVAPGNPGVTYVFPKAPLPTLSDDLASRILDYCAQPKTKEKITGKFRQHGDNVLAIMQQLEKQHRLERVRVGKYICFQVSGRSASGSQDNS
jgi:hypothetical protein